MTANATWNIWNFRRPVVEALLADGNRVTVLAPLDDAVRDLEHLGCRVRPLTMSVKGLNPLEDLKLQCRFKRIFREEEPDVVLSYTIKNNVFGAQAARSVGVPFLPNVTGLGTAFLSSKLLQTITEQLYRRSFSTLTTVFLQNKDDRDLFLKRSLVRLDQAQLLPGSGIDLVRFAPAAMLPVDRAPVFLMIARLLRDKGVLEFVDAARKIKARHPKAQFQLLGAAGSENRSAIDHATVDSWVKEGVVEYLGTTQDVRPAIAAASCVLLPSYREGAPRTLIEAAAMARPVISTNVPGCRAVVDHNVSGFLCDVRSAESLAAAIERFLSLSPEAQQAMGQSGRAKMEQKYDQSIVVDAYRDAISRIVRPGKVSVNGYGFPTLLKADQHASAS
jgi:glycosyltransferase involved in cell wall biosynthesis